MSDLLSKLRKFSHAEEGLKWEGTLGDYLGIIEKNPELHMGAHKRVLTMIESHGLDKDSDGNITGYKFFENDLFGMNDSVEEIMSYLRAAAAGSEVGRRILLMYGPTSSGKSQLAILIKRGLEAFSKTVQGSVYRLKDSPMNEDPMCAIPLDIRPEVEKQLGIRIEGELSPLTALLLKTNYNGNFLDLPVER